ncbi:glycosyltransferase family 2 protein [Modestobacter sp. Leaf380]|uniref:glycosyltransferase family 2 protein n=1 Tax=Modestobacter sp. Leaf380 TaxID=1736356 RepID=UPI0006F82135|nr:glycosyltransferase family 2 protein [Modestobacter sp. Leaf380]KQS68370.1 hypothetical protein ASG41_05065 [Modestobacter sp. Leaf380]
MSLPLVSVLVPTYNGERYLSQALHSALTQTHRNIEVLVGDDCSTDSTPAIVAEFAARDPRVRVLSHERNVGPRANTELLLRAARGPFVKYLLHDDLLSPACIQVLLKGMRSPQVSLAFSQRTLIDGDGRAVPGHQFPVPATNAGVIDGRTLGSAMLEQLCNVVGEVTTALFRTADVDLDELWTVDGRRLHALEDLSLWLRLLRKGDAWYEPRALSSFRSHDSQRSRLTDVRGGAAVDWPRMCDWGRRHGYLTDPSQERRAYARALVNATAVHAQLTDSPWRTLPLEAAFLALSRLAEIDGPTPDPVDLPLQYRAHHPSVLRGWTQSADTRGREFAVAVAAPGPTDEQVTRVVEEFRRLRAAGVTRQFVVAVTEEGVTALAPVLSAAIEAGPDIDVDLVPTPEPRALLSEDCLAVCEPGDTWHQGRAGAVWVVTSPCTVQTAGSSVTV